MKFDGSIFTLDAGAAFEKHFVPAKVEDSSREHALLVDRCSGQQRIVRCGQVQAGVNVVINPFLEVKTVVLPVWSLAEGLGIFRARDKNRHGR